MVFSFRLFVVRGVVALLSCCLLARVALPPAPAAASLVAGLAAYWNFEDDVTTNQVPGGADATVLTGSPTVGVMAGAPALVGNAMVLDGRRSPTSSRDSIQLPFGSGTNAGAGDLGTSFTISAWYWQASDPIDRTFVFETGEADPPNWHVGYGTAGHHNTFTSYIRNTGAGSVTTSYEEWHHVLHSFSEVDGETTLSVYVDGTLRNTRTVTEALDVPAINVGTYRSANARFFHGMIDEVALWDRALTGYEANAIYRMGQAGSGLSSIHVKADNTDNMNLASSWESGVAPDASSYLVFNATYAQTGTLDTGAALPVAGLWITDGTAPIHINNTNAAHYLELGALGVDMSTATRDLTVENLRLGAAQTWDIASGRTFTAGATSDLAGDHSITKTGGGTAVLSGANTYTGGTTLAAGTLRVGNNDAVGTGPLAITGGTLSAVGTLPRTLPNDVQLGGNVTLGHATNSGTLTLAGEVDLGGATRQITTASDVTIAGVIDNGGLRKAGAGTLSLTGENTYAGGTTIAGGTLAALSEDALGSGPVTLAGGALHVDRNTELANDIVLTAAAEQNHIRGVVGVDYLVVGGGGGGAGRDVSGGGGGGGVVSNLAGPGGGAMALGTGIYDVAVGDGGEGGVNTTRGANGEVSFFDTVVALGGGAGGPYNSPAASGASGGGSGRQSTPGTGTDGQGFAGGSGGGTSGSGGGGGGAGAPGGDGGTSGPAGSGGDGLQVDIDGSNSYYGGGGGGTWHRNDSVDTRPSGLGGQGGGGAGAMATDVQGTPGEPNTGGGGGASRSATSPYWTGGKGGSGIVVVRYPGDPVATGGTITAGTGSAAGYTLHTFTDVGPDTLTFGPIDLTIAGTMSGTGGFTWDTPGTLTLTSANTHSGQTRVTAGTLALGNTQAVQNSTLNLKGGTVAFTAPGPASYTLGGLAGKGTVDAGANSLVVGGNNESTIYIGNLTAAELTKTGSGTLSLSGSNTLGGTRISGGALVAASEGAVGDGAVTLAGGALHVERSTGFSNQIVLDAAAEENFIRGAVAADYLVVGGGGGGAGRDWGGGGGGGGVLSNLVTPGLEAIGLAAGDSYDVTVGDGGDGGTPGGSGGAGAVVGDNGEQSSFEFVVAAGGGAGGLFDQNAKSGASGGGAGRNNAALAGSGIPGQGFDGGDGTQAGAGSGGGGGGAGAPGGQGTATHAGDGGDGLQVDIDGSNSYYGGGGGGTGHRSQGSTDPEVDPAVFGGAGGLGGGGAGLDLRDVPANPGEPNTGGGGGAARSANLTLGLGGKGGSGVVIVRYLGDQVATGGTITTGTGTAAGYTLHTFTDIGAHTLELFHAINATVSSSMTGSGGFTWDTPGTLTLTGTSDYTGATRITAGTLALAGTGSIGGSATIDVHAGATFDLTGTTGTYELQGGQTLQGEGTVRGGLVMNPGSWLSPGASPGILSYDGDLALNGAGLLVDIFSDDGPGTGHDLLDFISGTLTLTGDPQITVDLGGFNPAMGSSYTIISGFENEVTGGFDPDVLVQNAGDPFSFEFFRVDYGPGSIALTLIPEPGTLVLLVMGLLGLLGFRRRRR